MCRLLVLHNAMREDPLGEELMPLFFTSPLAKRQRRSASAATVGKVDVQAVAESIADCCAPSPRALEACHRAVQAVLDGETSTLDLEGLSLDELPHALLHLRVDAVLADTERLSEDEASLRRGLGEPGGWEAASARGSGSCGAKLRRPFGASSEGVRKAGRRQLPERYL